MVAFMSLNKLHNSALRENFIKGEKNSSKKILNQLRLGQKWAISPKSAKFSTSLLLEIFFFVAYLNLTNIFAVSHLKFFFEHNFILKTKNQILFKREKNLTPFYDKFPSVYENLRFKTQTEYGVNNIETFRDLTLFKKTTLFPRQQQITTPSYLKKFNFLYSLFFMFTYSTFDSQFAINHQLNVFGMIGLKKNLVLLNFNKIFYRWSDTYDFLINMYYYKLTSLVFSSPIFKKETLALNWHYSTWDAHFWRYYSSFFILQLNKYHQKTDFFFHKLREFDISYFIITDCSYHAKNLFYFKRNSYYTLGLVNANNDPRLVSYPIISFFESYLTQSLFFKFLIYSNKQALILKFINCKQIWFNYFFKNFTIKQNARLR